ncbi:hypothetical protein BRC68_17865 [Halobacteriales archaeon QH_6_64_20]|nr:MAG: hypothetical protein BRC68_17865 [Halobacteriales archaeon QH_6_64_20]
MRAVTARSLSTTSIGVVSSPGINDAFARTNDPDRRTDRNGHRGFRLFHSMRNIVSYKCFHTVLSVIVTTDTAGAVVRCATGVSLRLRRSEEFHHD